MRSFLLFIAVILCWGNTTAQDRYERNSNVDVQAYTFHLSLSDESDKIQGTALVNLNFTSEVGEFRLDLIGKDGNYGMEIIKVLEDSSEVDYSHVDNKISIQPSDGRAKNRTYLIEYAGVPETGLIIDKTKFGQRSFFGDNWPNRARYWLPCVDHPYDKATVHFAINAPEHYDVIATGKKVEESSLGDGMKVTRYFEPAPVAMKVVTIGVTRFATKVLGSIGDIEVSAWVYPENRMEGFSDYAVATRVMTYFIRKIGPYSYSKLANMQAKTQWGGLENAGTIAYNENSVTGNNTVEGLIAHEIAHQWFGNSVTENDWNHVWLSEGFATYFTILYLEQYYGSERRKEESGKDRQNIIDYYRKNPSPIVDPSIEDPMKVLSTNSYQKGGWVLNMLRHELGDEYFWEAIRNYYRTHMNSNAMTSDLQHFMEDVSGKNLDQFFKQWVFTEGYPEISMDWKYSKGKIRGSIKQHQNQAVFQFPLELGLKTASGMEIKKVKVKEKEADFEFDVSEKPLEVILDPNVWLLFDEK